MTEPAGRRRATKTPAEPPPRAGYARQVADIVPAVGGAAFRRFGFVQASIVSRWGEIVGERYARVSTPESIRFPAGKRSGGTLALAVEGAHGPMMQHVLPDIVERVNRFFGYEAVVKVALRQGAPATPKPQARAARAEQPIPAELGDSLREVADPELKAVLEALARGLGGSGGIAKIGRVG